MFSKTSKSVLRSSVQIVRRKMYCNAAPTISNGAPRISYGEPNDIRKTTDSIAQKAKFNYNNRQHREAASGRELDPSVNGLCATSGESADEYGSFSSASAAAARKESGEEQEEVSVYDDANAEPADSRTSIGFADRKTMVADYLKNSDEKSKGLAEFKRFETLNRVMGGFRPGEFTIISGTTGVGKTTFLTEYCLDLAEKGVRTLFCSFEMSNAKIMETILLQYCRAKIPLHDPKYHDLIDLKLEEIATKIPNFRFFNEMQYKKLDEPIVGSDGKMLNPVQRVFQVLEKEVRREKIGHLIIDNLQYLMGAKDYMMESAKNVDLMGNRFVRQDNFIRSLRSLANERDVHISLVIHPRKEGNGTNKNVRLGVDSIYGGGRATQEADNVMIIQKPRLIMNKDGVPEKKKYLWILKNRYEGDTVDDDRLWMKFNRDTKCHEIIDEMPPKSMHDDDDK